MESAYNNNHYEVDDKKGRPVTVSHGRTQTLEGSISLAEGSLYLQAEPQQQQQQKQKSSRSLLNYSFSNNNPSPTHSSSASSNSMKYASASSGSLTYSVGGSSRSLMTYNSASSSSLTTATTNKPKRGQRYTDYYNKHKTFRTVTTTTTSNNKERKSRIRNHNYRKVGSLDNFRQSPQKGGVGGEQEARYRSKASKRQSVQRGAQHDVSSDTFRHSTPIRDPEDALHQEYFSLRQRLKNSVAQEEEFDPEVSHSHHSLESLDEENEMYLQGLHVSPPASQHHWSGRSLSLDEVVDAHSFHMSPHRSHHHSWVGHRGRCCSDGQLLHMSPRSRSYSGVATDRTSRGRNCVPLEQEEQFLHMSPASSNHESISVMTPRSNSSGRSIRLPTRNDEIDHDPLIGRIPPAPVVSPIRSPLRVARRREHTDSQVLHMSPHHSPHSSRRSIHLDDLPHYNGQGENAQVLHVSPRSHHSTTRRSIRLEDPLQDLPNYTEEEEAQVLHMSPRSHHSSRRSIRLEDPLEDLAHPNEVEDDAHILHMSPRSHHSGRRSIGLMDPVRDLPYPSKVIEDERVQHTSPRSHHSSINDDNAERRSSVRLKDPPMMPQANGGMEDPLMGTLPWESPRSEPDAHALHMSANSVVSQYSVTAESNNKRRSSGRKHAPTDEHALHLSPLSGHNTVQLKDPPPHRPLLHALNNEEVKEAHLAEWLPYEDGSPTSPARSQVDQISPVSSQSGVLSSHSQHGQLHRTLSYLSGTTATSNASRGVASMATASLKSAGAAAAKASGDFRESQHEIQSIDELFESIASLLMDEEAAATGKAESSIHSRDSNGTEEQAEEDSKPAALQPPPPPRCTDVAYPAEDLSLSLEGLLMLRKRVATSDDENALPQHYGDPRPRRPDLERGTLLMMSKKRAAAAAVAIPEHQHAVKCEGCQRRLLVSKSAIVVQCPKCRTVSPASSIS